MLGLKLNHVSKWGHCFIFYLDPWEEQISIKLLSFEEMNLQMASTKWRPSCLGLMVLCWGHEFHGKQSVCRCRLHQHTDLSAHIDFTGSDKRACNSFYDLHSDNNLIVLVQPSRLILKFAIQVTRNTHIHTWWVVVWHELFEHQRSYKIKSHKTLHLASAVCKLRETYFKISNVHLYENPNPSYLNCLYTCVWLRWSEKPTIQCSYIQVCYWCFESFLSMVITAMP